MARPGRRWPAMWCPACEQTRLPARSAGPCTGESLGTSSRWLASKYTVENAISSARAQVIVVAFATMSTVSSCTALMRSGSDSRRNSTLSGSPSEVPGDLAGDVDVEALQFAGHGIAKAEQIGALVHTDDQPAAAPYRLHGGADRGGRAQTGCGIAAFDGRAGRVRHHGGAAGHRQRGKRSGHLGQRLHRGTAGKQDDCKREQPLRSCASVVLA